MRNTLKAAATATLAIALALGGSGIADGFTSIQSGATGCCRMPV